MKARKKQLVSSFIDNSTAVSFNGRTYPCTVRPHGCDTLISASRAANQQCIQCIKYRNTLRSSYSNFVKPRRTISSTKGSGRTNLRFLSTLLRTKRANTRRLTP